MKTFRKNRYGSHDPAQGGMDCSGTIYHLLRFDFVLPRKGSVARSGTRPRFIGYASIPGLGADREPMKTPGKK